MSQPVVTTRLHSDSIKTAISFRAFVVRPYQPEIRKKVFAAVEQAGGQIPEGWVADKDSTDAEVVATLRSIRPDVLVMPFHIGRDREGNKVHGLSTYAKLLDTFLWARQLRVIMPVSVFGAGACKIAANEFPNKAMLANVLEIDQSELTAADLPGRIAAHVRG